MVRKDEPVERGEREKSALQVGQERNKIFFYF